MNNIENANNDTVQKSEITIQADNINPHILWKQILGLSISSIIISFLLGIFGSIFVVITGIFTFIDAWKAGIYKKKKIKSFLNNSPMSWGIGIEFLLIVVYPI